MSGSFPSGVIQRGQSHPLGAPTPQEEVVIGFMVEVVPGDVATTFKVEAPRGLSVFPVGVRVRAVAHLFVIESIRSLAVSRSQGRVAGRAPLVHGPVDASIYSVRSEGSGLEGSLPVRGGQPGHVHGVPYVQVKGWPVIDQAHPLCFTVRLRKPGPSGSLAAAGAKVAPGLPSLFEGYVVGIPVHHYSQELGGGP